MPASFGPSWPRSRQNAQGPAARRGLQDTAATRRPPRLAISRPSTSCSACAGDRKMEKPRRECRWLRSLKRSRATVGAATAGNYSTTKRCAPPCAPWPPIDVPGPSARRVLKVYPHCLRSKNKTPWPRWLRRQLCTAATGRLGAQGNPGVRSVGRADAAIAKFQRPQARRANRAILGHASADLGQRPRLIAHYKLLAADRSLPPADPAAGRARLCPYPPAVPHDVRHRRQSRAGAHRLEPAQNLDYLLSNVVDPVAARDRPRLRRAGGSAGRWPAAHRAGGGEDSDSLTLVTANDTIVVPKNEIEERTTSKRSMMPKIS